MENQIRLIVLFIFLALSSDPIYAQEVEQSSTVLSRTGFGDFPSEIGTSGKCYAKCRIPDCIVMSEKTIKTKEGGNKFKIIPAEYEMVTEQILAKEASTQLRVIPAEYEVVTEQVLVKEASTDMKEIPPVFKTIQEKRLVSGGQAEWVRKIRYPGCSSVNPDDCYIMCWENIPAKYETITKEIVEKPGRTEIVEVPAKYKTITKKVVKRPASVEEIAIPAEYKTITKKVLKRSVELIETQMEDEYTSIPVKIVADSGKYGSWEEVLCDSDQTSVNIAEVQKTLLAIGYNVGKMDGVFGRKTKVALEQFQKDQGLPIGNLNLKTLDALGVHY